MDLKVGFFKESHKFLWAQSLNILQNFLLLFFLWSQLGFKIVSCSNTQDRFKHSFNLGFVSFNFLIYL